jgi:hypothetical protein
MSDLSRYGQEPLPLEQGLRADVFAIVPQTIEGVKAGCAATAEPVIELGAPSRV